MIQSSAVIEWLEERYPSPPLLPSDADARAFVLALAAIIGNDVHPVNNRRSLEVLRHQFDASNAAVNMWCGAWISAGFDAYDALIRSKARDSEFSYGAQPTVADVYLIPQMESARRFGVDLGKWPRLQAIDAACSELEAFKSAAPAQQPDAS